MDLQNGTYLNCTINECDYGLYYDYQVNLQAIKILPLIGLQKVITYHD